jgi:hypothetical protein
MVYSYLRNDKSTNVVDMTIGTDVDDYGLKTFYEELETKRHVNVLYPTNGSKKIEQIINNATTNFTTTLRFPIHRWYYYKEGFSAVLVENLLNCLEASKKFVVLDPFCGVGTTPLVCMYRGIPSFGLEINPFSNFLAKTKTRKYEKQEIQEFQRHIRNIVSVNQKPRLSPPNMKIIDKLFDPYIMEELLMYKEYILNLPGSRVKDLLLLGWLAILEDLSNYRKAGNGLKLKTPAKNKTLLDRYLQRPAVIRGKLLAQYKIMLEDLEKSTANPEVLEPEIFAPSVSALDIEKVIPSDSISLSVFSPTYANCFDYAEIYKVELWMGDFVKTYDDLRIIRKRSIRSHLNTKLEDSVFSNDALELIVSRISGEKLWDKRIPLMLQGYFEDMANVFKAHSKILKEKGKMVVVVGNSAYAGVVVPTDLLLCEIAESLGFKTLHIDVVRPEVTSSQQFRILQGKGINQYMRESIVYFEKIGQGDKYNY